MTTLSKWFSRKARKPLFVYVAVAIVIQVFFFSHTVVDYNNQVESRIQSQVKNVVAVGIGQHNREIIESSMSVIVDELGAKSILLCQGRSILFSYPLETPNCTEILSGKWEKLVSQQIDGTSYKVYVFLPKFSIPWAYFFLNLFVGGFIAFGFLLIYRMQVAVKNDLLEPVLNSIFGDQKLQIKEFEGIRIEHLEKRKLEKQKAVSKEREKISHQVTHDIRSPLSALKLIKSSFAKNPEVSEKIMDQALRRIDNIIEDLEQSNKVSKKTEVSINLKEVMDEIVNEKKTEYKDLKISLEGDFEDIQVAIEKSLLLRVLSNLINNSVEATLEGKSPEISLEVKPGDQQVRLKVLDNGQGIAPDDLKKVMEYGFTKGKKEGTGTGLAYAKKVLTEAGGYLVVESKLGIGTSVSMYLLKVQELSS